MTARQQPKKLPHGARDGLRASCACVGQRHAAIHVSSLAVFFGLREWEKPVLVVMQTRHAFV
jgi:hypothetical protein